YPTAISDLGWIILFNGTGGVFNNADAYDPFTNTWARLPTFEAWDGAPVADLTGRLYVLGGETVSESFSAQVQRLSGFALVTGAGLPTTSVPVEATEGMSFSAAVA